MLIRIFCASSRAGKVPVVVRGKENFTTLINHREGPEDKPDYFVPRQMDIVLGIDCTKLGRDG